MTASEIPYSGVSKEKVSVASSARFSGGKRHRRDTRL
jgi:hypothetical protein